MKDEKAIYIGDVTWLFNEQCMNEDTKIELVPFHKDMYHGSQGGFQHAFDNCLIKPVTKTDDTLMVCTVCDGIKTEYRSIKEFEFLTVYSPFDMRKLSLSEFSEEHDVFMPLKGVDSKGRNFEILKGRFLLYKNDKDNCVRIYGYLTERAAEERNYIKRINDKISQSAKAMFEAEKLALGLE